MVMTEKKWKIIARILLIASFFAALKMIFFDYTLDEEYQIVMAYRNISGDQLFTQMWEPHQTSAFLCAFLMKFYMTVTGGSTCLVIFLRVCTTAIQIALSVYLYRTLCLLTHRNYAFLLALTYFNIVPKMIQIPEFGGMQVWFFTLMILFLIQLPKATVKMRYVYVILIGLAMSMEVLSYPSCVILFPFMLLFICKSIPDKRWVSGLAFTGTCAMAGGVYLLCLLSHVGLEDLLRNANYIVHMDLTHDFASETKLDSMVFNLVREAKILMIAIGIAVVLFAGILLKRRTKDRKQIALISCVSMVIASCILQIWYWVVKKSGFEFPQIQLVVLLLVGCVSYWYVDSGKRRKLLPGIIGSVVSYIAVIYFSDLQMVYALPHGIIAPLFCMLLLVYALELQGGRENAFWCYMVLIVWCVTSIFGKGFTLRDGRNYNTVLETRGIMKYGPAKGIFSDYMSAYIYNCNYEDWEQNIEEGDKVLIVSNLVMSSNTTPYMFFDSEVSHYSIVDPTAYDERLLTYWELYPEKKPNVIVVDCWYGELKESTDSFIMQYIEEEFGYTSVVDGRYVRFYRR